MSLVRSRSPLRLAALAAAMAILAVLGPIAVARPAAVLAADPTGPTPVGSSVTIHGRGYGHGVGLNQYGARGRALAGATATEILAHYYQGATTGSIPLDTPIRVRVLNGFKASSTAPLVLYGRRAAWVFEGSDTTYPKDARIELRPRVTTSAGGTTVTWRVKVIGPTGTVLRDAATGSFRLRGATVSTVFQVASRTSKYDTYRGALRIGLKTTAPLASATNELKLERYLRGVLPAEMPSTWPTEALKAQAIAARSYAARRLRPGVSYYDVPDDTTSQVYLGVLGEKPATTAVIDGAPGVVLKSGSSIANTLFHSTGGGATEDNENVYVSASGDRVAGPVSYLRGSRDRRTDGTAFDDAAPYATWKTRTYTRAQLSAMFSHDTRTKVGTITALDLRDRGVSGRLISVTLIGSLGTKTVSGNVFRDVFNANRPPGDPSMRSTLFDLKPVP
ncbi:MAG TPA: SpoIID/LytB domain-containing protein [Methylomirabilota bacterium]|nr:SpoIID/LytB domain-containing protein [Methylomirabilota bacterium]